MDLDGTKAVDRTIITLVIYLNIGIYAFQIANSMVKTNWEENMFSYKKKAFKRIFFKYYRFLVGVVHLRIYHLWSENQAIACVNIIWWI